MSPSTEDNSERISVLESKYDVIAKNTEIVIKLAAKVSLLLSIMSFVVVIVSGGAMYTFTALANFKDVYAEDRLALHNKIVESQKENRILIQDSIHDLESNIDDRMDIVERKVEKLGNQIDQLHKYGK